MSKTYRMAAALAVLALTLSACSTSDGDTAEGADSVELRLGHALDQEHPQHATAEMLAEELAELSEGELTLEVFPDASLGDDVQLQESVSSGSVDLAIAGNSTTLAPKSGVFLLPYLFPDADSARAVSNGELADEVYEEYEGHNIEVLGVYNNGFRQTTNNKRPIDTPEDLKGLKIRVPDSKVWIETMAALGANPTPMSFTEVYSSLQQGVLDGQENPVLLTHSARLSEVQDHLAITDHMWQAAPLIINQGVLESLSEEHAAILQEAVESSVDFNWETVNKVNDELLIELEDQGMQISRPDLEPFRQAAKSVDEAVADEVGGADFIEKVRAEASGD